MMNFNTFAFGLCWAILFGFIGGSLLRKLIFKSMTVTEAWLMALSLFLFGIAIGFVFGG